MKLLFGELYLFLFIILIFQCITDSSSHDSSSEEISSSNQKKVFKNLYIATNRTFSTLLSPLCYQIVLDQGNTRSQYISSKGLTGRVIPPGTFTSEVLALEYLYGIICEVPNTPPALYTVQSYQLKRVAYNQNYLITQNELILNLTSNKRLTFFTNLAFDKDYKLCGYDGQIRNFGLTFDPHTDQERQTIIGLICNGAQQICTGALQQYASVNACIQYLTTSVPFGSHDAADQGNVICRLIHTKLAPLLPSVHCPHIGPSGGDACVNKTMEFYYNQPDFLACAYKYN